MINKADNILNYLGLLISVISLILGFRLASGTINEYVCPSCKGVVFDIDRFKFFRNGKITKSSAKKYEAILQLLNDSPELSELQCPSCSKDMNSFEVLYQLDKNQTASGNVLLDIAAEVADVVFNKTKKMQIEGCKACKSLWLDKTNGVNLSRATILSEKESLE